MNDYAEVKIKSKETALISIRPSTLGNKGWSAFEFTAFIESKGGTNVYWAYNTDKHKPFSDAAPGYLKVWEFVDKIEKIPVGCCVCTNDERSRMSNIRNIIKRTEDVNTFLVQGGDASECMLRFLIPFLQNLKEGDKVVLLMPLICGNVNSLIEQLREAAKNVPEGTVYLYTEDYELLKEEFDRKRLIVEQLI